jgi:hypothetical protein
MAFAWGQSVGSGPGSAFFGARSRVDAFNQREQTKAAARAAAQANNGLAGAAVPVATSYSGGGTLPSYDPYAPTASMYTVGPKVVRAPDNAIDQKGDLENAYAQHGQEFFAPGAAQQFNEQHGADYLTADANQQLWQQHQAAGPMVNNAQREYDQFHKPNIASEPGFGSYYDNAQKNTINALNTQLGARGAYGSSVGLGQIGKSVTDLRADQAKNEADYNLRRLTEQRGWNQLGGELARGADLSGQSNRDYSSQLASNASDSRYKGLNSAADAANAASRERQSGLMAGMTAAGASQAAREGRVGLGLEALLKQAGGFSGLFGNATGQALGADQALLDAIFSGDLGALREKLNYESQKDPVNQAGTIVNAGRMVAGAGK